MNRRTFVGTVGAAMALGAASSTSTLAQTPIKRVLWAANVRTKPLADRLLAANIGGYEAMSVFPIDYKGWRAAGMTADEIRARCRDAGIRCDVVDPYVQWVPNFEIPPSYPAEGIPFIDTNEEEVFRIADELGATQINVVEGLNQPHERSALIDALGGFTERAAARGLKLGHEPMPISSIPTLAAGWDLVQAVGHDNLGLTFDTWHFWRSDPDHALLATIPGNKIVDVQMVDGAQELQGDLLNDLLHHRLLPGEGVFDLETTVSVLKDIGGWRSVGLELFSDAMDALDAQEVGRVTGENLSRWS
jgi:sugar phosphate isomerase/epimerase